MYRYTPLVNKVVVVIDDNMLNVICLSILKTWVGWQWENGSQGIDRQSIGKIGKGEGNG